VTYQKDKAEADVFLAESAAQAQHTKYGESKSQGELWALTEAAEDLQWKTWNLRWQCTKIHHLKEGWLTMDDANKSRWLSDAERDAVPDLLSWAASAASVPPAFARRSSAGDASEGGPCSAGAASSAFPSAPDADRQSQKSPTEPPEMLMPKSESDPHLSTGGTPSAAQLSGSNFQSEPCLPLLFAVPPDTAAFTGKQPKPETKEMLVLQSESDAKVSKDATSSAPQLPAAGGTPLRKFHAAASTGAASSSWESTPGAHIQPEAKPKGMPVPKSESDADLSQPAATAADKDAERLRDPPPFVNRLYPQTPKAKVSARSARRAQSEYRPMRQRLPNPEFPMPNRVPPFVGLVLDGAFDVGPQIDFDWTLHEDWTIELHRREERSRLVKDALQAGHTVVFRSSGGSLWPRVHSGDSCTYAPVNVLSQIGLDDVVFCAVQPGNRFMAHVVKKIFAYEGRWCCTISNLVGRENGWCEMEHIYGKLIRVEH
jgi:hypothetical protein